MGSPSGIGKREREILTAIVETYISTGEPVGSRTLARSNRESLSAASIRNVMADLSDAGFLEQPHTSAGRIPTAQAYRFYVKQLTGEARLSPSGRKLIQGELQGTQDVQEFMERTSHVLSLISHGVGVTVSAAPATAQRAGARLFSATGRQESARRRGDAQRAGARPRAAPDARSLARRSGSGGRLHQPELSRLGDGGVRKRNGQARAAGAQRI